MTSNVPAYRSAPLENEEWYRHFMSQADDNRNAITGVSELMTVYESLRNRDSESQGYSGDVRQQAKLQQELLSVQGELTAQYRTRAVDGERLISLEDSVKRFEQQLRQKTKQIESQQALLNDLQSQLSLKEGECRDLSIRLNTTIAQNGQLQNQLESTHKLLEERSINLQKALDELSAMKKAGAGFGLVMPGGEEVAIKDDSLPSAVPSGQPIKRVCANPPKRVRRTESLKTTQTPSCIAVSQGNSGTQLIVVGTRRLHVIDGLRGVLFGEADLPGSSSACVLSCAVSSDCSAILVGSSECHLSLVDAMTCRVTKELKGHTAKIKACGFLGGTSKCFSASQDRTFKTWDLGRSAPIRSVPVTSQITGGICSLDGTLIVTGHMNGKLCVWSANERICEVAVHKDACLGVCLSRDGRYIASLGKDDSIAIVDIHMAQAGPVHSLTFPGYSAPAHDCAPSISGDSRLVSACGSGGQGVSTWDLAVGTHKGFCKSDAVCLAWHGGNGDSAAGGGSGSGGKEIPHELITCHPNGVVKWWESSEN